MNYSELYARLTDLLYEVPPDTKVFLRGEGIGIPVAYRDVRSVYLDDEGDLIIEQGEFYREEEDDD